jgi:hypothetical protein
MRKTQKIAIVGGTVAVLFAGGVAYAAWTSSGSGTGSATAGSAVDLNVSGDPVSSLYPTVDLPATVDITNPNPYNVTLSSLDFTGATVDLGHSTCDPSTVTVADLTGLSDVVQANGANTITKDVTVSMSNAATDACQGATFTLSYTAHGASS